jgi:YggT family protein
MMLNTLRGALVYLLKVIQYAILARAIISWLPISNENPLIRILNLVTEPILAPIKAMLAKTGLNKTMFDVSPIVAFLLIGLLIYLI